MAKVCEHGLDYCGFGDPPRCRKHARLAVGYSFPFGVRIGPHGEKQCFGIRVTFRCHNHEKLDLPGDFLKSVPIGEYEAAMAAEGE